VISLTARELRVAIISVQMESTTTGGGEMKTTPASLYEEEVRPAEAAKQVAGARHLLMELRKKLRRFEDYPELQEAITKLEMALNILTIKTGGML
jgi:L-alanine-DL-glutamate epimerase-like enolase superfamily enzyme